jgi:hypothetical protein
VHKIAGILLCHNLKIEFLSCHDNCLLLGGCRVHTVWYKLGIMYMLTETSLTCALAVSVKEKNMKENIKSVTENCVPVLKFSQWGEWGLKVLVFWLWCCSAVWGNPWSWRWNVLQNAGNRFSSDSITSQKTGITENCILANEIIVICAE